MRLSETVVAAEKSHKPIPKKVVSAPSTLNEAYDYPKPSSFSRALRLDIVVRAPVPDGRTVGGLAVPLKEIPEVPDKIMVGIKGFDQWSFRNPPMKRQERG